MGMASVKIISNPFKQWAQDSAKEANAILENAGFRIVGSMADATVCFGGDGTILYANHEGKIDGAVLGVGGERSVICQLRKDNWKEDIVDLLKKGRTERKLMLEAICGDKKYTAINDFVVHSKDYRVIWIDVEIKSALGSELARFEADGLIVSTATGSHAYAYSAGGKKLNMKSKKIEIVPICPYKREFSAKVLPQGAVVTINADREAGFVVDGIFIKDLAPNEKVTVQFSKFIRFFRRPSK